MKRKGLPSLAVALLTAVSLFAPGPAAFALDDVQVEDITTQEQLIALLNDTGTMTGSYRLQDDFTVDTNSLRPAIARGGGYSFAGTLDGNGKTITVETDGEEALAPLFDTLRGSIGNLNVVFMGDAKGTTIAYDIGHENVSDDIDLTGISVTVNGNVLFDNHDYLRYYAKILSGDGVYGNWYLHYGGQPVNLATGFAWYVWGASLEDVTVNVTGNVGSAVPHEGDSTAAGFTYFGLKGGNQNTVAYRNIAVGIDGDIVSVTNRGFASAYGFATGTVDGSTAGFGGGNPDEVSDVRVSAQNIIASSNVGASSAMGFARFMQGYTHECSVVVPGKIQAICQEGDADKDQYSYMNGDSYAYGFMLNTGGWSIEGRRNFVGNSVDAGAIEAKTQSAAYEGTAFASGFAHQMMNTASSVPDLTYNSNRVNVANSIIAEANKGSGIAAGFTTSTGRDYYDRPDHIYANSVTVGGDISAKSLGSEATAAGYAYYSKTHFRDCSVHIGGNLVADSPVEAVAAGFVAFQYQNDNHYFVKNCSVEVEGDVKALRNGDQGGMGVAAGLMGVLFDSTSSVTTPTAITGNTVSVGGAILADNADGFSGITGLMIGLNDQKDPTKSKITLKDNCFIGQETLISVPGSEALYTNFVGQIKKDAMDQSGNSVLFTKPNGKRYSSPVTPVPDGTNPDYVLMWELSDPVERTPIVIEPVDLTFYVGGEAGYAGIVEADGSISPTDDFPNPGFTVTLPDGLSMDDIDDLEFKEASGDDGKTWKLELYGDTSADVFKLVPAEGDQDTIRMEVVDPDGNRMTSDDFTPGKAVNQTLTMGVYKGGEGDFAGELIAALDGETYDVDCDATATLTVRGTTDEASYVKPREHGEDIDRDTPGLLAAEDTTFALNDTSVTVADTTGIALLFDEVINADGDDRTDLLRRRIDSELGGDGGDRHYDLKYLDLVDANNGNAWVTADKNVTICWPLPEGTDSDTQFKVLHFTDAHRSLEAAEIADAISHGEVKAVDIKEVTDTHVVFEAGANGFSPFALVWEASDSGGGPITTYYTLRYESNGGTEYADERHAENTTVQLEKTPVRKGHTFTGWYADKALTLKVASVQMTGDKTVYAGWKNEGGTKSDDQNLPHVGDSNTVALWALLGASSLMLLHSARKRTVQ